MDFSSVQPLLDWVSAHPHWAGVITMLIACGESLAMVGIIVPGIAMLWGVGTLVGLGKLDLMPILLWAALGGFLGDIISYALGRRFHEQLRGMWPLTKYPDLIPKGEAFFAKHGGKSVIMGRFLGPMRAIIPAVAGMLNMPMGRFITIDIFACVIWAPPTILPGVAIGASLGIASEIASRFIVMVVVVLVGLAFTIWSVRRLFLFLQPRADEMLERVVAWSKAHRWAGIAVASVVDPEKPESRGLILLGGAWLIAAWIFILIMNSVADTGTLLRVDAAVAHFVHDLRTPWTDYLMIGFASLSEPAVMALFAGVVAGWLFVGRHYLAGAHWLAAVAYGILMPIALHLVLSLPTLEFSGERLVAETFPSMNMTLSTVLFGFFAAMVSRELRNAWRWVPYAVMGVTLFAVMLALISLEMQTLSNATGGLALGLAWAFFLGLAYRRHVKSKMYARGLAALALTVLALSVGWRTTHVDHDKLALAIAAEPPQLIARAEWRAVGWAQAPAYRMDWEGLPTQPLTVQWAGDLNALSNRLQQNGWRMPVPFTFTSAILWLAPNPEFSSLPLFPQVHDGRHAVLELVKATSEPGRMLVLRLWPSPMMLRESRENVWTGSVIYLDLVRRFDMFVYPRTVPEFNPPLEQLISDLGENSLQRVHREPDSHFTSSSWSGDVVLGTLTP